MKEERRIVLPARASPPRAGRFVPLPKFSSVVARLVEAGYSEGNFKLLVRKAARKHPYYHLKVSLVPPVQGRDEAGRPVPVDTLGRWLFGVPGYAGNAIFDGHSNPPGVWLPQEAPPEADEMFLSLQPEP